MKRIDWTERLAETLEAHRQLPFRWAGRDESHDCCTLVAACIDAMTGSRKLDALVEHYHDEPSARAYIAASGGLAIAIGQHLGKPKPVSLLRSGDVVVWVRKGIEYAGLVVQDKIVSAGARGLVASHLRRAVTGWAV